MRTKRESLLPLRNWKKMNDLIYYAAGVFMGSLASFFIVKELLLRKFKNTLINDIVTILLRYTREKYGIEEVHNVRKVLMDGLRKSKR